MESYGQFRPLAFVAFQRRTRRPLKDMGQYDQCYTISEVYDQCSIRFNNAPLPTFWRVAVFDRARSCIQSRAGRDNALFLSSQPENAAQSARNMVSSGLGSVDTNAGPDVCRPLISGSD